MLLSKKKVIEDRFFFICPTSQKLAKKAKKPIRISVFVFVVRFSSGFCFVSQTCYIVDKKRRVNE